MSLLEKRVDTLSRGLSWSITKLTKDVRPRHVHLLRTTIRRVETLVGSVPLDLSKKQKTALNKLARLRKRAGKVRDFDVQLDLLGAIANGSTASDKSLLAEYLQGKREKQADRLQSAMEKFKGSKSPMLLKEVFRHSAEASHAARQADALIRAKQHLAGLSEEFADPQSLKSNLLHDVRIRLKMIRYLAEQAEESEQQKQFLDEMKNVQDALGAWHDWEELATTAEAQFGDRANCPLLLEIRALFAAQQTAAKNAVLQLFARNIRKFPRAASLRVTAKRA
jgi:CHAD domain-containing protein